MTRIAYTFNGEPSGSLELDSRILRCINADGTTAWTRSFHTRREARDCFVGDLRAMRKNDCYVFDLDVTSVIEDSVAAL